MTQGCEYKQKQRARFKKLKIKTSSVFNGVILLKRGQTKENKENKIHICLITQGDLAI